MRDGAEIGDGIRGLQERLRVEMSNLEEGLRSMSPPRADEWGPTSGRVRATRLEQALDWAAALAPSPIRFASSCCGMSMARGGDFFEAFGTGPPAVSSRSADLLIVAGSLTRREVPLVRDIYQRMLAPRWVIAWGACSISGGAYDNYATISGLSRILPVDLVVPGCPPEPKALREALALLRSGSSRNPERASRETQEWPIQKAPDDD